MAWNDSQVLERAMGLICNAHPEHSLNPETAEEWNKNRGEWLKSYHRVVSHGEQVSAIGQIARLKEALRILLASRNCLHVPTGTAEIPEEVSAQFDILLDDAKKVCEALK